MIDHEGKPNVSGFHKCSPTVVVLNSKSLTTEYRPDYYLYGQFMKFIQAGARRVATTSPSGAPATVAFKNPDGSLVLVAANPNEDAAKLTVAWHGQNVTATMEPKSAATLQWAP